MDWDIQNANSIHFFGDSLTAGYGTLPQYGWIYQISRRCPAIQYYNHGLCGAGLEDIFDSLSLFLSSPHENALFFYDGWYQRHTFRNQSNSFGKMMLSEINKLNKKNPSLHRYPSFNDTTQHYHRMADALCFYEK